MVYLVGAGRSGTTLFRVMLAGHAKLFVPPEMSMGHYTTMAERRDDLAVRYWEKGGLRRALVNLHGISVDEAKAKVAAWDDQTTAEVYRTLQAEIGERILVDKCPQLAQRMTNLERAEATFDKPIYLWIVRHPCGTISSFLRQPLIRQMMSLADDDPTPPSQPAEAFWYDCNHNLETFVKTIEPERWFRFRYEDLTENPEPILRKCCETIGVPFEPACLDPYAGDRMASRDVKGAQPVGDPGFPEHSTIKPELAKKAIERYPVDALRPETRDVARRMGYDV